MPRAIPILVIVGLAIYSFFDVLQTEEQRIRRLPKTAWLVLALVPVIGAALWFMIGRPVRSRGGYGPPRTITLRSPSRPKAPDDDAAFLKKLDEEAWRRKREQNRAKQGDQPPAAQTGRPDDPTVEPPDADPDPPRRPKDGPATGGPGIAPAG